MVHFRDNRVIHRGTPNRSGVPMDELSMPMSFPGIHPKLQEEHTTQPNQVFIDLLDHYNHLGIVCELMGASIHALAAAAVPDRLVSRRKLMCILQLPDLPGGTSSYPVADNHLTTHL